MSHEPDTPLGASLHPDGSCSFCVWAPLAEQLSVHIHGPAGRMVDLARDGDGYHTVSVDDVTDGARYTFRFPDGRELPDPASRHQPDGVHAASAVVAREFDWQVNDWTQYTLDRLVIQELHVGTFTREGTFDAAAARLPALREVGINAIELMPVAQFPGSRNWGYDGVFPFAAQSSYGGPHGLKRLVDAAHGLGMAVVLDVVYNHLGPEGNYLPAFAPVFTDTYHTPWGAALNFDDADSDHVRRFFIDSALQWTGEFRIDALRLDAIHSIYDRSAQPFLRELGARVREQAAAAGRTVTVIAESDLADPRVIRGERAGGLGLDAQWLDDFHHSLRTLLTGQRDGYYVDYGTIEHLATAYRRGYVYTGQYSQFRRRRHGAPAPDIRPRQFVVYAQNHDQIGNRLRGDRLTAQVDDDRIRLAAACVLLSPFTPMLFMGEEYGERAPFPYFVSHGDADLVESVRAGRRAEFAAFGWQDEPPDPQAEDTFRSAVLDWSARTARRGQQLLALHRELIALRMDESAIREAVTSRVTVTGDVLAVERRSVAQESLFLANFSKAKAAADVTRGGTWRRALDTAGAEWGGSGATTLDRVDSANIELAPWSAVLLLRETR